MVYFLKSICQAVRVAAAAAVVIGAGLLLPHQVLAGTNQWTTSGPYGAYAYALAISPQYTNDQTLFVGTWGGGVFKTVDGELNWSAANSGLTNLNIRAMAISPNYAVDQTVYAGTFTGVVKSADGGASWTTVNTSLTNIYALAVSPNYAVDQTILAGSGSGTVIKSTNGGATWTTLNLGVTSVAINGFAISPNYASDQTIYVATHGKGVYKSTNGGSTWTAAGLANQAVQAIALSPNFAADQMLYAAYVGGVSKTTNGGSTWIAVNTGLTYFSYTGFAISPNYATDQTVFVTTLNGIFRTTNGGTGWTAVNTGIRDRSLRCLVISPDYAADHILFAGSSGGGINKSVDGGIAWAQANTGLTNLEVKALAFSPDYASDGTLFAGTWLGENLYKSIDRGAVWSGVTMNLPASDTVEVIAFSPKYTTDQTLFAGTASFGVYKSTNGGASWTAASSGLGSHVLALALSPNYENDHTLFAGTMTGLYKSTNGGTSWSLSNSGIASNYIHSIALSPDFTMDHEVYAGASVSGGVGVYKSTDGGATWTAALTTGAYANVVALSPAYPTDHTIYAGTVDGVYKSVDGGATWNGIYMGGPNIASLAVSPGYATDQTVFAGLSSGGVYKSTNGGSSSIAMNSGLTSLAVQALACSPTYASDQTVFAGTKSLVFSYRNTYPTTEATAPGYPFNVWTSSANVEVTLTARDHSGTGIASGYPQVCMDSLDTCTPGASYQAPVSVTCPASSICRQYVRYRSADNAGHVESVGSVKVMQDLSAPLTTASPAGGVYSTPPSVTLECSDAAGSGCAAIFYTIDGSDPTVSSPRYVGPISITDATTLKFRSVDTVGNLEPVINSEVYTLVAASATLTASPTVQMIGSPLTLTAAGQGGTGSYEFEFWTRKSDVTAWTKAQDYSASNSWTWDTAGNAAGPYNVKVYVRCAGSTAAYEALKIVTCSLVETAPATGVTLAASPTSPQMIGQTVAFTANGQGGSGDYVYRFLLKSSGATTWNTVQDYSPANTWSWDTTQVAAGTYSMVVYVRNAGSPAPSEASRSISYSIAAVPPATVVTLTADWTSPTGRIPVSFIAKASNLINAGPNGFEYKFRVKNNTTGIWTVGQEYGPPSWWWDTADSQQWPAGSYTIQVMARAFGSNTEYDVTKTMEFILSDSDPATTVTLNADRTSPIGRIPVSFTAKASNLMNAGPNGFEYKFRVKNNTTGIWTVGQEYGPLSWWWDTPNSQQWPAGSYTIQVMARAFGSNTEYDVTKTMEFILSDSDPATAVTLNADRTSPIGRIPVSFTAEASNLINAGPNGFEYKFRVKNNTTGIWTVGQEYGPLSWWWDTPNSQQWPAGSYTIQVMARAFGSNTEYDVTKTMEFILSDSDPATAVTLNADRTSPIGRIPVSFTAKASNLMNAGPNGFEYKFRVKNKATGVWTVGREYGSSDWWWDTADSQQRPAGSYTIQVMARSIGSGTEYDVQTTMEFIISDTMPATSVDLAANVSSPAQREPVMFTAAAQGGTGMYEYKFLVRSAATGLWAEGRDYQSDEGWMWDVWDDLKWPAGKYTIQVQARSLGSGTEYDVLKNADFTIVDDNPVSAVALAITNGKESPSLVNTVGTVQFTAAATGTTGNYQYQYLVKNNAGTTWTTLRVYDPSPDAAWSPTQAGSYTIQVRARNTGSPATYEAYRNIVFVVVTDSPVTEVSLVADKTSPKALSEAGTITFTAQASGTTNSYEYQFLVKSSVTGLWTTPQGWSDAKTFPWTPLAAGTYTIQVRARNVGSPAAYEAYRSKTFSITE